MYKSGFRRGMIRIVSRDGCGKAAGNGPDGNGWCTFPFVFEVMLTECAVFRIQKEKTCVFINEEIAHAVRVSVS